MLLGPTPKHDNASPPDGKKTLIAFAVYFGTIMAVFAGAMMWMGNALGQMSGPAF